MPELTRDQRAAGPHTNGGPTPLPPAWQELADRGLPVPDQSRYGPPGTTDSPRFRADGRTPWPRTEREDTP